MTSQRIEDCWAENVLAASVDLSVSVHMVSIASVASSAGAGINIVKNIADVMVNVIDVVSMLRNPFTPVDKRNVFMHVLQTSTIVH